MLNKKAQSVAEYAIFISMMVAAIAMMQLYVKRGLQARYADGADMIVRTLNESVDWTDISTRPVAVSGNYQYEPFDIEGRKTQWVKEDKLIYKMALGGNVTRDIVTRTQNQVGDGIKYHY
jgi:hypothetical protein